jgi:hypothetical protein
MIRRKAVPNSVRAKSRTHTFPAPIRGWITNENLAAAQPMGAKQLDNMFPTQNGLRVRGGLQKYATVHATDDVLALMGYRSANNSALFAATEDSIFDISNPVDATTIPTASVTGQTSADYSYANVSTAGGEFMLVVNGADKMRYFDATTWRQIDDATTELPFDNQTANYTAGLTVTGGTSAATGVIVSVIDNGATGTLRLKTVVGTFQDNELVTDSATGSATSNIPTGVTTVPAITGVTTDKLSHVWIHKSRVWFVEKNSLKAWYLPVDQIGGAAGLLSLQGIFQRGGKLIFGATWSQDAGDGMDDYCVFVSDQGEAAVYQGTNPGSASTWAIVGVFNIGKPLHKNATMRAGGDLMVATRDGLIPISAAITKDPAALALAAVSRPIEPTWRRTATNYPGVWSVTKWVDKNLALVAFPADGTGLFQNWVVNLQTGAWARYVGWDVTSAVEFGNNLYIGNSSGFISLAETSGADVTEPYYCTYVGLHERLGNVAQEKTARMARATWRHSSDFNFRIGTTFNYGTQLLSYPAINASVSGSLWDTAHWDEATWGGGMSDQEVQSRWTSVAGRGFTVAPVVQTTMGTTQTPDVEFISFDFVYETGAMVT